MVFWLGDGDMIWIVFFIYFNAEEKGPDTIRIWIVSKLQKQVSLDYVGDQVVLSQKKPGLSLL